MKGRYGIRMTVYGSILPGAITADRYWHKVEPLKNEKVRFRLKIISWHQANGQNISLTSRHFGFTRKTIRKWLSRFKAKGNYGLLDLSRRPKSIRKPSTSFEIVNAVVDSRKQYPAWSKYKLQVLLKRKGLITSASTVGRILKRKGLINPRVSKKRHKAALRPKKRYPKCISIREPGDLVQLDTKEIVSTGGVTHFQFTATDVFSKFRVLDVYPSCSSRNGKAFLDECCKRFPFKIKSIQTDNGKEFLGNFHKDTTSKGLPHYFIHPHCPKENTYVERSHGSDEREFYQLGNRCVDRKLQAKKLKDWEKTYNEVRPHQALDYMTPKEFYESWKSGQLSNDRKFIVSLQT